MMNVKRIVLYAVTALVLVIPVGAVAGETPWFDLEGCAMCKNMVAEEGLMEHMEWENFVVTNGMMSITVVDPDYEEAFERSMAAMEATGMKMMSGEEMYLCGFCQSYGSLHMAGATVENIDTKFGSVSLVTSDDPALVKMIQAHAETTISEYEKMMAEG